MLAICNCALTNALHWVRRDQMSDHFHYPITWAATHHLRRIYNRFWRVDAAMWGVYQGLTRRGPHNYAVCNNILTPLLPQPVTFPGWKMHARPCKQYSGKTNKQTNKRLKVWINFRFLVVVFKRRDGSEGVNVTLVFLLHQWAGTQQPKPRQGYCDDHYWNNTLCTNLSHS